MIRSFVYPLVFVTISGFGSTLQAAPVSVARPLTVPAKNSSSQPVRAPSKGAYRKPSVEKAKAEAEHQALLKRQKSR